jgi:hypothetical protein
MQILEILSKPMLLMASDGVNRSSFEIKNASQQSFTFMFSNKIKTADIITRHL